MSESPQDEAQSGPATVTRSAGWVIWVCILALSSSPLALMAKFRSDHGREASATNDPSGLTLAPMIRPRGLTVTSVMTDGPAEQGGIEVGDVLRSIDGLRMTDLRAAERRLSAGPSCRIRLDLLRRGAPIVATVDRCKGGGLAHHGAKDTGRRG